MGAITIEGDPVAWERVGANFKKQRLYDRQKGLKEHFRRVIKPQVKDVFFDDTPIFATVWYLFERLKKDEYVELPTALKYGDVDNLQKFLFDACNGVAYSDDRQISTVLVRKRFADQFKTTPRTVVEFKFDYGY